MGIFSQLRGGVFLIWILVTSIQTTIFFFLPAIAIHFCCSPSVSLKIIRNIAAGWFCCGAMLLQLFGIEPFLEIVGGDGKDLTKGFVFCSFWFMVYGSWFMVYGFLFFVFVFVLFFGGFLVWHGCLCFCLFVVVHCCYY